MKDVFLKGLKNMFGALPLLFLGPVLIHSSFKNQEHPLFIYILILGILVCSFAVYIAYKGIKIIIDGLFNEEKNENNF